MLLLEGENKKRKNPIELQKLSKENDDQREDRVLLCCLSMVQAVSSVVLECVPRARSSLADEGL